MTNETIELTEQEKWECTVRWLNSLYRGYVLEELPEEPCLNCPIIYAKCFRND